MKKTLIILIGSALAMGATAQTQDTLINRDVTVEREFQPVIQQAGKINRRPVEEAYERPAAAEVEYSSFVPSLSPGKNINPLLSQPMKFRPESNASKGHLKAAIGHPQTMLDLRYVHSDGKRNSLAFRVEHEADWGFRTLEFSALGLNYEHSFRTCKAYVNMEGANLFYTRYGRYYNEEEKEFTIRERYSALADHDKQAMWRAKATVGVQSNSKQELQYKAEATYQLYNIHTMMSEHQANARVNVSYRVGDHKFGGNLYSQNQFVVLSDSLNTIYEARGLITNSRHCIRMEPFYEYRGRRVFVHAGVNFDLNVGKGHMMSASNDSTPLNRQVAFAPSPNIRMEAQLAPKWAVLFADVRGSFGTSAMPGYVRLNPYMNFLTTPSSHHVSSYTPVDAELGFLFRPHRDLIFELHAGYWYAMNQAEFLVTQNMDAADPYSWNQLNFLYTDFQRWKIGGELNYHYRDIISLHVDGDYYIYRGVKNNTSLLKYDQPSHEFYTEGQIYDRPNWELNVRIDGHIDSHWSVYSENVFKGKRMALTSAGDCELPAFIELNLGTGYQFGGTGNNALDRLYLFFELQNFIHRHNMVWYGYMQEGIHGRVGLTYRF